ncbi:MAG: hypothetical protein ACSHYB_00505 [Roseibacillus sp.]
MGLKAALGRPLYRYSSEGINPGGYLSTSYRDGAFGPSSALNRNDLSSPMKEFLVKTQRELAKRDVVVVVTFPWFFMTPEVATGQRAEWQALAEEISKLVPVLYDPNFGVSTDIEDFADTAWHLSEKGALKRTSVIGKTLKSDFEDRLSEEK